MRRLPPMHTIKNLAAICELIQDDEVRDDVMIKSDQPLQLAMDEDDGREFLQCEYNKDGDSYRSPWSNKYFPPVEADDDPDYQPIYPSQDLLEMEGKANDLFFRYCKLYYDSDFHSSVYFFDTDTANGFGSCWLIKKTKDDKNAGIKEGCWDAVHLVTTTIDGQNKVKYRLNSTIFLFIESNADDYGNLNVGGQILKVKEEY
jgi:capping protein beta